MNRWFELIDRQSGKRYRIDYDKPITKEKRERWRKEWKTGKIAFQCGCGCPFGLNAKGAMYYPAELVNKNGERRHTKDCVKYREEVEKKEEAVLVLTDIPKHPKEAGLYRGDWERICRVATDEIKSSNGGTWSKVFSIRTLENGAEKRLKHYSKDIKTVDANVRVFVVARIKELKPYPYGFVKLTLLLNNQKSCSVWLSDGFVSSCGKTIQPDDVFVGFCFVRNEQWKGTTYRKIYVLEGLVA